MREPEEREIGRVYFPSSPGEFITLFAHFHRAEIARMAGWRDRIDRTTNWAITLVAAMLSVSLSTSNAHHSVLMFAMVLAFFLLMIEFAALSILRRLPVSRPPAGAQLLRQIVRSRREGGGGLAAHHGCGSGGADIRDVDGGGRVAKVATQLHLDIPDPAGRMGAQGDVSLFQRRDSGCSYLSRLDQECRSGSRFRLDHIGSHCCLLRLDRRCRIENLRPSGRTRAWRCSCVRRAGMFLSFEMGLEQRAAGNRLGRRGGFGGEDQG